MQFLSFKALHFIGFIAWFAGIFYLVRLFVYHAEAMSKSAVEQEILVKQYTLMERRLFGIITRPAMLITFVAGIAMLVLARGYLHEGWMHIKLTLVLFLAIYTEWCRVIIKKLATGIAPMSSMRFRMFNEVPTVLLIAIVLLAVFRNSLSLVALSGIIIGTIILLGLFFFLYSKRRKKKEAE
jgi:putative membrane protein